MLVTREEGAGSFATDCDLAAGRCSLSPACAKATDANRMRQAISAANLSAGLDSNPRSCFAEIFMRLLPQIGQHRRPIRSLLRRQGRVLDEAAASGDAIHLRGNLTERN